MKHISKLFFLMCSVAFVFAACEKVGDLPYYKNGVAPVLTTSVATVAPAPADSTKPVITFSWTDPQHATDSSKLKYIIQIDSAGRNFSKAVSRTLTGTRSSTFLAKELNNILLDFGFKFGQAYDIDARVISSYANNNEQLVSNTIKLKATPYKVPPKVALPSTGRLFITGNATQFDWTNPNPMPAVRELTRIEETKWTGIFRLSGGGNYLILQQPGNWDDKYAVPGNAGAGIANGGTFGFKLDGDFAGNVTGGAGWYRLTFDFQEGTFTVKKAEFEMSADLYITGDATVSNWTNTPPANQKFQGISNGVFEITVPLTTGKFYKFLGKAGEWAPQFGGSSATGGNLGANFGGGNDPDAVPVQGTSGNYKINVNLHTSKYTVTKL